jgi:hypothetical protein
MQNKNRRESLDDAKNTATYTLPRRFVVVATVRRSP